jgi:hypothetical protein
MNGFLTKFPHIKLQAANFPNTELFKNFSFTYLFCTFSYHRASPLNNILGGVVFLVKNNIFFCPMHHSILLQH